MIQLPPSIQVNRDEPAERALLERARRWLEADDRKDGIHASDILMPRRAYFKYVDPKPWTAREVGLFLVGKVLHAFILSDHDEGKIDIRATDEGSRYSEELGLWYSPDHLGGGTPVEFKTNRGMYPAKTVEDLETYLRQLLIYMAAEKSLTGKLVVFYTNTKDESRKTSPRFEVYDVTVTEEELQAVTYETRKIRDALVDSITEKNFSRLPLCPAWLCHPEQCVWWKSCKPPGRFENREYLESKRK